ncbi:MAG: sigma-70 family RNA polymerase sigma factor [Alphaproteobacteria bacterium]|nr:sigma-70 family RNA polymerase sigma factor [Alphaproteobacteria bacterium]
MGRSQSVWFDFETLRPKLFAVAYRMLGSVGDAEDIVQDCFLRWQRTTDNEIRDIEAYLVKIVTRLCLDFLKSARVRRETYIGEWLPEPLITEPEEDYPHEDVSLALLYALERLSPLERASFLLHDVFGYSFGEVARQLGKEVATCRQLAARARKHLHRDRPKYRVAHDEAQRLTNAFFKASYEGDEKALGELLSEDVVFVSDGGGKVIATINPIFGRMKVSRLLASLARKKSFKAPSRFKFCQINHMPGFIAFENDGLMQTVALEIVDGKIVKLLVTRNPDKLGHLSLN